MRSSAWINALVCSTALSCSSGSGSHGASDALDGGVQTRDPIDGANGPDGPSIEDGVRDSGQVAPGTAAPKPEFVSTLPPLKPGEPITGAKLHEWQWVPVPEARCMGNDATGMHFSLGDPTKLAILMEGGGACYNSTTCTLSLAIHPIGATATDSAVLTEVYGSNLFNRDDPNNPIRDYSYVFFPYCSGDVFAGASSAGSGFEGRTQQGYYNVQAYLRRLIASFPAADKVLLTGVSAGGFGAALNFDQVQEAFGQKTRVYLLDDSGPPLPPAQMSPCLQERWREAWSFDAILPPDAACPGCRNARTDVGVMGMVKYLKEKYRNRRLGVISGSQDAVIREFFGFGLDDCAGLDPIAGLPIPAAQLSAEEYEKGLKTLFEYAHSLPGATMEGFVVRGSQNHTFLLTPNAFTDVKVSGLTLGKWLTQMLDDDPSWSTVGVP